MVTLIKSCSAAGTMMSYPFIFSSAFGTVISTLGSKYIGARDDRAYLRLGIIMIVISGIIGATLGTVVVFFADDLLNFFTQEQDVIDVIKPVFPIVVPYIAAGTHYIALCTHCYAIISLPYPPRPSLCVRYLCTHAQLTHCK